MYIDCSIVGDYDSIYGFAAVGTGHLPCEGPGKRPRDRLKQLAEGGYGIIYITEKAAAELGSGLDEYREMKLPAVIQIRAFQAIQEPVCQV